MSSATRQKLVDDPRLVLTKQSQRSDLLEPARTNTWLVEFLRLLLDTAKHPIMITALNSDHSPGTNHGRGRGVDCWHADWASVGDDKVLDVMQAAAKIGFTYKPALVEVGLSGTAAKFKTWVTWPTSNVFVEYTPEHLHFAVGTPS